MLGSIKLLGLDSLRIIKISARKIRSILRKNVPMLGKIKVLLEIKKSKELYILQKGKYLILCHQFIVRILLRGVLIK
jgi:hypothetical protein